MSIRQDIYVLGLNPGGEFAHHPSAALLKNGEIVALAEEERFVRVKEAHGYFPARSIQFCLKSAGISIEDVTCIALSWDPFIGFKRALNRGKYRYLKKGLVATRNVLKNLGFAKIDRIILPQLSNPETKIRESKDKLFHFFGRLDSMPFCYVDHHYAHAASSYFVSGFEESTVVSWDAWGNGLSGMVLHGKGAQMEVIKEYDALDLSIGWLHNLIYHYLKLSDKGNLMGLAGYGEKKGYFDRFVDLDELKMDSEILTGIYRFSDKLISQIGEPRKLGEPLNQRHKDIAADLQDIIERLGLKIAEDAVKVTGSSNLCLAGGVALNATLNGKLLRSDFVGNLFIQPQPGDAGGALGAAFIAYQKLGYEIPKQKMEHVYWGMGYTHDEIKEALDIMKVNYEVLSDNEIIDIVSDLLIEQKIVGWFQGRTEWGPRALGARSILADPRNKDMLIRVNKAAKYRDLWRPFAPSMIEEAAEEYLEDAVYAPFMIITFPVKPSKKKDMAAVVHVDGTSRPQTVKREINPLYYDVIHKFGQKTGVPVVLNTSFNLKGEPIVNSPIDAIRTFYGSGIDALIMGNTLIKK